MQGGVVWNVGADFIEIDDDTGTETVFLTETELRVDLRLAANAVDQNIVLLKAPFNIPSGRMETFNPSEDFVLVLEDGTELRIPAVPCLLMIQYLKSPLSYSHSLTDSQRASMISPKLRLQLRALLHRWSGDHRRLQRTYHHWRSI